MTSPGEPFALAHWRHTVADIYAAVRQASLRSQPRTWDLYRARRDHLFRSHPQTPLSPAQLEGFCSLDYYPYDPAWRVIGIADTDVERETFSVELPAEGQMRYTRVARLRFAVQEQPGELSLFWIEGYGGGLFLPFRDATNSRETYGGGRYLYDTIKGADLGASPEEIVLDFNYAYNPSCAYNDQWVCPLAPQENRLPFAVEAGENAFTC
jgi:uncharacterized protein (DUF1684 family)